MRTSPSGSSAVRRLACATTLALLGAVAGSAGGKEAAEMSETFVFYSRGVGSAGTLSGSFTAGAALVRTNASLPGVPRIGDFREPMAPGAWESLAGAIRALGPPRPGKSHRPGTPMMTMGIMASGKAEVIHSRARGEATPEEEQVFSRIDALAREVMKHPHLAIEAAAEWENAVVAPDDDLVLRVRVSNPSLGPVSFAHPMAEGSASHVAVALVRTVPTGVAGGSQEVVFTPANLAELGPDGKKVDGPPAGVVTLSPGKEVRLRARSRLRLPPAGYRAFLKLHLAAPPGADEKAVSGHISVDLPVLSVERPGGRGGSR